MRVQFICLLSSVTLLCSCTSAPTFPSDYGVSVAEIVDEIRCELGELRRERMIAEAPLGWTAGVNLSLETLNDANTGVQAGLSVPLNPGTFVATVGGSYQGSAKSTSVVEYQEKITKMEPVCKPSVADSGKGGLNGNLRIVTWLQKFQDVINSTDIIPTKLTYTVEFVVTASGNLAPKFTLLPIGSSTAEISPTLGGKKQRTNKMTLVLTKKMPPPEPMEVVIKQPKKKRTYEFDPNNKRELDQTIMNQSGNDL